MKRFECYVDGIERLAKAAIAGTMTRGNGQQIDAILNGEVAEQLRTTVGLSTRRRLGAFFTSRELRQRTLDIGLDATRADVPVIDVACGAGDLLLGCVERLPGEKDLSTTLARWGEMIHGFDIQPTFVRAAKARLALAAASRVGPAQLSKGRRAPQLSRLFPGIQVGNGLTSIEHVSGARTIVINPPFGRIDASKGCEWSTGKVSAAAVFLARCIETTPIDGRIVAILPDVLRTGSRYRNWRSYVMKRAEIEGLDVCGKFGPDVDVDVFILALRVRPDGSSEADPDWWTFGARQLTKPTSVVRDRFVVSVGPIVPHRDPKTGHRFPYIFAKILPPWASYREFSQSRRFAGRTFTPPFVVVRRTSSPGDPERAIGTVILGNEPVGVENHLLVLEPIDGSETSCRELLDVLRAPETQNWLNQRIRCRHLTVGTLKDLPWIAL